MLERVPIRPSIIEQMAENFYTSLTNGSEGISGWSDLPNRQKQRFIDAMAATVSLVPDHCEITQHVGLKTIRLVQGRRAIINQHRYRER